MPILHTRIALFSPTGTTRNVLEAVAAGIDAEATSRHDLTLPASWAADEWPRPSEGDLAVIGVPVYAGRVPNLAVERLRAAVAGGGMPAVLVVVYGNRAFDDALLELRDLAVELGFAPVAGAAFVGEHSFSTREWPVGQGRPDDADLALARDFGRRVREMLEGRGDPAGLPKLTVPGNFPYREGMQAAAISPDTEAAACVLCGECERRCPTGAVRLESEEVQTSKELCLRCLACVRSCPTGARAMLHPRILEFGRVLHEQQGLRKEPQVFMP